MSACEELDKLEDLRAELAEAMAENKRLTQRIQTNITTPPPQHPYWCYMCGEHAPFTIAGCPIPHDPSCPRYQEDPMVVYRLARAYVQATGKAIP